MEDNKLIAEFMGFEIRHKIAISPEGQKYFLNPEGRHTTHRLLYNKSWDWLMPVVEKIESLKYHIIINKLKCEIYSSLLNKAFKGIYKGIYDNNSKLQNTYKEKEEYIKRYNKNNI